MPTINTRENQPERCPPPLPDAPCYSSTLDRTPPDVPMQTYIGQDSPWCAHATQSTLDMTPPYDAPMLGNIHMQKCDHYFWNIPLFRTVWTLRKRSQQSALTVGHILAALRHFPSPPPPDHQILGGTSIRFSRTKPYTTTLPPQNIWFKEVEASEYLAQNPYIA